MNLSDSTAQPGAWKNLEQHPDSLIAKYPDSGHIRYAQCWEDADVLLAALEVQPGATCLSIASAGDNTLALLSRNPGRVIAIDLSFAQIACLALRVAAYRCLTHEELLRLLGVKPAPSHLRLALYQQCRFHLSPAVQQFWDDRHVLIQQGVGTVGKFEQYLSLFRQYVLPLVHSSQTISKLWQQQDFAQRQKFYLTQWNTRRWRWLFHLFFSRQLMGLLGRDRQAFDYVQGSVAASFLARTEAALCRFAPKENPYLQWLVTGQYSSALPYALRPENFERIRQNLDCLEWHCLSLESFLQQAPSGLIDHYNLSDIFEWMSPPHYRQLLTELIRVGRTGGRLVYWNLLVDRHRPDDLAEHLRSLTTLGQKLYQENRIFFYQSLVIEEIILNAQVRSTTCQMNLASRSSTTVTLTQAEQSKADGAWDVWQAGEQVGHCGLWWKRTPTYSEHQVGLIGHYQVKEASAAAILLDHACQQLAAVGCTLAIAPMDGHSWQSYRCITTSGSEPPFFLEPSSDETVASQLTNQGFYPLAHYHSALNQNLTHRDPRSLFIQQRLEKTGIRIRCLDLNNLESELRQIYQVATISFRHHLLYMPISEAEFAAQYRTLLPFIQPEFVLLATHSEQLIGFLFAIPNWLEWQGAEPWQTLILKTIAVLPDRRYAGLGQVLFERCHEIAKELGFQRAIYALIQDGSVCANLVQRYATTIRHYTLFAKVL